MAENISRIRGTYTFSATIIGAGILALPVAAAQSGFLPLLAILILVAVISIFSALYIAEAVLGTDTTLCPAGSAHLPSLALEYLGRWGLGAMLLGTGIYIYGALIGYLTAGGQLIFVLSDGAVPIWAGICVYFGITAVIIYCGLILVSYIESYLFYVMLVLLASVIGLALSRIRIALLLQADWLSTLDVFGVVLFAYVGHSVIPSIINSLARKTDITRVVFWGIAIPFLLYAVWSLVVIGIVPAFAPTGYSLESARNAGQPATIPLGFILGSNVILLGNIFAVISTMTSYIGFGLSLQDEYTNVAATYQKRVRSLLVTTLVVVPPLGIALINPDIFVTALGIAGVYGGGLFVGILPVLIVIRLRRKNLSKRYTTWGGNSAAYIILGVYLAGMIYTTIHLLTQPG